MTGLEGLGEVEDVEEAGDGCLEVGVAALLAQDELGRLLQLARSRAVECRSRV